MTHNQKTNKIKLVISSFLLILTLIYYIQINLTHQGIHFMSADYVLQSWNNSDQYVNEISILKTVFEKIVETISATPQ
ncbi:MAG: hypothetical protein IPQ18_01135 [Saprospiraceae bacterium]|jgi:hypothetical protein|nr:hypothetical protein [Saprospiraceae bacterium]MBL0294727.1 hypothetical protein [Saprospiraceae bacterium]